MSRARLMLMVVTCGALMLAACGEGSDYYNRVQGISDDLEVRYITLSLDSRVRLDALPFAPNEGWDPDAARSAEQLLAELGNPNRFTSEAVEIDLMMFRELRGILVQAEAAMADVEPHTEVLALHSEIQAICLEWAGLLTTLIDELEAAQSATHLANSLGPMNLGVRFDSMHERLDSRCVEMRSAANRDGSSVRFGGTWVGGPSGEATSVDLLCG